MKRTLLALALAATAALSLAAQTDDDKLVARVNGKEITNRDLNAEWSRLTPQLQEQYMKSGGKRVFLENYLSKYVVVQEAVRSGFAAKAGAPADLDPVAEAALFDKYVREVVAAPLITEQIMRDAYDQHKDQFRTPEQARLSVIRALKGSNPEAARERVSKAMIEIFSARAAIAQAVPPSEALTALASKFAQVAMQATDDKESAKDGGDIGWVALHTIDPKIATAARQMKPGTISGLIETDDAYQLVLMHSYRGPDVETFDAAKDALREFLMARNRQHVMDALRKKSAALRASAKLEVFPQNIR
ncbi:MAG TPA: peptidylprolyl isomerase [Thermoanaerobaculia bacterium]|jgi:parvulin-like peptidyl-prolyl isomerase|nr:peptidylprolyl isomerase [Thermoanaerobaculia bacterium]